MSVLRVQIWGEPRGIEATLEWRTIVEHIGSGERRHAKTQWPHR